MASQHDKVTSAGRASGGLAELERVDEGGAAERSLVLFTSRVNSEHGLLDGANKEVLPHNSEQVIEGEQKDVTRFTEL